ncbi:MAG: DUF1294 domain-containing protein [Lachnospiraceae bacterium]|nr:DUF1294 domain-containing protein [Lachnospiraceae bacterium]
MKLFIVYLIFINGVAFSMMGIDKYKAKHNKWRISERSLFMSAILLGSGGAILGMRCFRHKTKHTSFVLGMPILLIIQIMIACFLLWH